MSIIKSFLRLMPLNNEMRFFRTNEREQAMAWLEELLPSHK